MLLALLGTQPCICIRLPIDFIRAYFVAYINNLCWFVVFCWFCFTAKGCIVHIVAVVIAVFVIPTATELPAAIVRCHYSQFTLNGLFCLCGRLAGSIDIHYLYTHTPTYVRIFNSFYCDICVGVGTIVEMLSCNGFMIFSAHVCVCMWL